MKNYWLWLKITAILQLLTGLAHAMSFLVTPEAANDTEKHLLDLLQHYLFDLGGFHRTMNQIIHVLSAHFSLAYLFAGLLNWYLSRKKAGPNILRGIIHIQLFIFTISTLLNLWFAFLPPMILTGLCWLSLVITRISLPQK